MPDMKYGDSETAKHLSNVDDYVEHNQAAIREMYRQVGPLQCDASGAACRGLLVRHLVLPDSLASSQAILDFLDRQLPGTVDINIMDQYRPCYQAETVPSLRRRVTAAQYQVVVALARQRASLCIIE